jgi:thiamine biosynthesis lipoprotein
VKNFELHRGGIATSGDARRFLLKDGIRYSHILNPLTGWPVKDAPRSITVLADTCTEAGILATLAMLQGTAAEQFLDEQQVKYWIIR